VSDSEFSLDEESFDDLDFSDEQEVEEDARWSLNPLTEETKFLYRLIVSDSEDKHKELEGLVRVGFNTKLFSNKKIIDHILQHYQDTRSILSLAQIKADFPEFDLVLPPKEAAEARSPDKSLANFFSTLSKAKLTEGIREFHDNIADTFNDGKKTVDEIFVSMEHGFQELARMRASRTTKTASFAELIPTVVKNYQNAKKGFAVGTPIPFPVVHRAFYGWQPANTYTVLAETGVGKTWFLLGSSCAAAIGTPFLFTSAKVLREEPWDLERQRAARRRVLVISIEMPVDEISERILSLMIRIKYPELITGKFNDLDERAMQRKIDKLLEMENSPAHNIIVSNASTPAEIASLADMHRADIVMIDGFYLMSGVGEKRWERVQHNSEQIRSQSLRSGRAYILTSQLSKGTDAAMFSQSIEQDSTGVVKLLQSRAEHAVRKARIVVTKARRGETNREYQYNWDIPNNAFDEQGPIDDEDIY
jgi:replicative DNA helicase